MEDVPISRNASNAPVEGENAQPRFMVRNSKLLMSNIYVYVSILTIVFEITELLPICVHISPKKAHIVTGQRRT